ncbi:deoxynucleotidyltransferase terminal-interacting protein 2 [Sergentomyia squamirostris]
MSLNTAQNIKIESLGLTGKLFFDEVDNAKGKKASKSRDDLDDFCAFMDMESPLCSTRKVKETKSRDLHKINVEEEMKNAVDHSIERLPNLKQISLGQKKKINQELRDKSKGSDWFNLPATEMTDDVKNDLKILQMRSVLDPKHFYKKNDLKVLPKYFQVGKYLDSPLDYHQEKHLKKNKSRTIVDDLLKDAEFQKRIKKKYKEILVKEKPYYRHKKSGDRKQKRGKKKK